MTDIVQDKREKNPTPGTYKHFKGGQYEVLGLAVDGHAGGEPTLVVYKNDAGQLFVRHLDNFCAHIDCSNRGRMRVRKDKNGNVVRPYVGPRFTRVR